MIRPDPIEILVSHQTAALVRCGRPMGVARKEAEDIVAVVLEDLARIGLADVYLSVALRRARVYRMKSSGLTATVISERLGVCMTQIKKDYRAELLRRRMVA
jgi:hypothetical protein